MARKESNISAKIMKSVSRLGSTIFKNPVGFGYVGKAKHYGSTVVIEHARKVRFGLASGSSDLIGLHPLKITPDMVGETVAVFLAIEVKTKDGHLEEAQEAFINHIKRNGGIAFVARSPEDAIDNLAVEKYKERAQGDNHHDKEASDTKDL